MLWNSKGIYVVFARYVNYIDKMMHKSYKSDPNVLNHFKSCVSMKIIAEYTAWLNADVELWKTESVFLFGYSGC